jgi:hypothetical protein
MFLFYPCLGLRRTHVCEPTCSLRPLPRSRFCRVRELLAEPQSASFSVRGSNGFVVDVTGESGAITVITSERRPPIPTFGPSGRLRSAGRGNGASTVYTALATATGPEVVDAGLGAFGRIAVRFRPSGRRVSSVAQACGRPIRVVRRLGVFVGTISFEGEEGYTTVAATSARGSVGTPLPPDCGSPRSTSGAAVASSASPQGRLVGSIGDGAVLSAADPRTGSSFRAAPGTGGVRFSARVEERTADGVTVVRHAQAGAPASAFDFNRALTWAAVTPPAPFSGNARFAAGAGVRWTGSLRVTFPGLSVPLTGPGFRSRLERP